MKAILFDLDGTLLPMDNDKFIEAYVKLLAKTAMGWGYDPKKMTEGLWKGTMGMMKNDGQCPNAQIFWQIFNEQMGMDTTADIEKFDAFYSNEYHQIRGLTEENPLAREAIETAREKAELVIIATSPLFPACGVTTRMGWVGLDYEEFPLVTNYENCHYCKPNPEYYMEILRRFDLDPKDCLMVGNDVDEDIIPTKGLGMKTFLITDCLINRKEKSMEEADAHGTFRDMIDYLKKL